MKNLSAKELLLVKILGMWVFPLKIKETILAKIKVIQKASYIYIYAFMHLADAFSAFRLYIFFVSMCSLGIEPTTFCTANAMLYH